MTREMITADLLGPLAPLLAAFLVTLASLPAVEGIRARLAPPRVPGVRSISRPRTALAPAAQSRALLRHRLAQARSRVLLPETPTGFGLPPLADRRLKPRPS